LNKKPFGDILSSMIKKVLINICQSQKKYSNLTTNETPTIEKLIEGMNLKGVIVTWYALNTPI